MQNERRGVPSWRKYVEQAGLTSAMNDTKWREVIEAMRALPGGPPRFRIKDIQGAGPGNDGWDREWYYHPRPWATIEWLEIDPDERREGIQTTIREIGVLFSLEGGMIRVWGWLRPGIPQDFTSLDSPGA